MEKGKRQHFSISEDLYLLREVVGLNPFEDKLRWQIILSKMVSHTQKSFTLRTIKDHVDHLIKLFQKEDRNKLRRSGTEEEYFEKEQLLQNIVDLMREFNKIAVKKNNSKNIRIEGIQNRENATNSNYEELTFEPEHNYAGSEVEVATQNVNPYNIPGTQPRQVATPTHIRKKRSVVRDVGLVYLQEKQAKEREIKIIDLRLKEREIELNERKQKLDEDKFALEKLERESRLEMEKKERESKLQIEVNSQGQYQKLVAFVMDNFYKKK
ncbi:unnamed protein product [Psylliodes chrysocephalus]|uniref:Uncharacterized protein n=1 Tax=Psylliodes chrysocephalus TaxID=3402493 RepID=A0A9P0D4E3_9CUCU|nr:unnamed protein product [Psylliodes chrysocephala]